MHPKHATEGLWDPVKCQAHTITHAVTDIITTSDCLFYFPQFLNSLVKWCSSFIVVCTICQVIIHTIIFQFTYIHSIIDILHFYSLLNHNLSKIKTTVSHSFRNSIFNMCFLIHHIQYCLNINKRKIMGNNEYYKVKIDVDWIIIDTSTI